MANVFFGAGLSLPAIVNRGIMVTVLSACSGGSEELVSMQTPSGAALDAGASGAADGDRDGIVDGRDNCPRAANESQADSDRDGVGDTCDNCSEIANNDQADGDADGIGDRCELDGGGMEQKDSDGDGVGDRVDRCWKAPDPEQLDRDKDYVGDACDNCPTFANYHQVDSDNDGVGDVCAMRIPDRDGDGTRDHADNCRELANADQADGDGDGVGDVCDSCATVANASQFDGDADGIGDRCDPELGEQAVCARGTTQSNPLKPNLYFLLDRSQSMTMSSGGGTSRMDALKSGLNALAGSAQMPGALLSSFNIGVGAFPAPTSMADRSGCEVASLPQQLLPMGERAPADAFAAFTGAFATLMPQGYTPTDVALQRVRTENLFAVAGDTATARSKAVVLITDGVPNDCTTDQPNRLEQTIMEAASLAGAGVPVFVLGFDGVNPEAMQRIADAGDPAPGMNPWYVVSDANSIVSALNSIITRTASCTFPVAETQSRRRDPDVLTVHLVRGGGMVRMDIPQDPTNGFTLAGDQVTLLGSACTSLQTALGADPTSLVEVRVGCSCVPIPELCDDDFDNDCDGRIDEDCIPGDECGVDAPPEHCSPAPGV